MAFNIAANALTDAQLFTTTGVLTAVELTGAYAGFFALPTISRTDVAASSAEVSTSLIVPLGAVITQAVTRVAADAPGTTTIGGIATVRASAGEPDTSSRQLVVDFGTLRTVSALAAPVGDTIASVTPWVGTKFDGKIGIAPSSGNVVTFTELQTERLLVELAGNVQPAEMASKGLVTTTTPPADLELSVAGDRIWFRVGPVPAGFTEDVDVTTAVQAAVEAAAVGDADGNVSVRLALTARVPGELGLTLPDEPRFLRTHTVAFPGSTTPVVFSEEGVANVALPLPADAPGWTIHRVLATAVPRDPGPLRVLPPDAPVASTEADLLLDTDRRLVARLPRPALERFERLAGIRLLLDTGADGIEIGGSLLTGSADLPGEPVADAGLTPVSLPAGSRGWASVLLAQPIDLAKTGKPAPDDHFWIAIAVTRGSARLGLAGSGAAADADRALLRRVAPNGLAKPLSVAFQQRVQPGDAAVPITADAAALRVIGSAPPAAPVDVVAVDVAAADGTAGGTVRQRGLGGSTAATLDPVGPRTPLMLRLTATAGTTVTVGPVVVAYTQPAGSGVIG